MTTEQLDFAFLAELPQAPAAARKRAGAKKAAAATPVDAEALALALQKHPDYRVLRRLPQRLDWPAAAPTAALRHLVLLDTETTGLDASRDKIIELALLRVDVDAATGLPVGPVQVYDGLEDPGMPISAEIQAITGIDDAMVRGQRLDEERISALLDGADLVVAHNAGFDRPFTEARMGRFSALPWACSYADLDWKAQGRGSAKLESLALELGLFYDAHRAEMDCHALLAVLSAPLPKGGGTGLGQLLERVGQPSYRLQATAAPFEAKDKLKSRGYRWNAEQRVWQTRLDGEAALQAECVWLKAQVYGGRAAQVQLEMQDACVRYSNRGARAQPRTL